MASNALTKKTFFKALCATAIIGTLSACDENGQFAMPSFGAGEETAATEGSAIASSAVSLVERDVEAPDVFQVTENGLWDGRPSLGGVWVAHPDVQEPERVIIRNQTNDRFVIGALFRRERENPGPALQVSSDAAEELGILAGAPTLLSVTALRREEGPATSEVAVEFEAPEPIAATPLDSEPEVAVIEQDTASITGAAAIAIAAAEASLGQESAMAPVVETETAPSAPAPAASALEKPFIQIGIFSIEANASRTSELLRGNGLVATVLSQESQGRAFWRVIVGPAPNAADRAAVLAKVKELGFEDAYFVTN